MKLAYIFMNFDVYISSNLTHLISFINDIHYICSKSWMVRACCFHLSIHIKHCKSDPSDHLKEHLYCVKYVLC